MKKAQSGLEFMLVTIVALFTLIVVLVILSITTSMKQDEQVLIEAEKISLALRNEIIFASVAEKGYTRIFDLPYKIKGYDYEIVFGQTNINTSYFELKVMNSVFYHTIPLIDGGVIPGEVIISHEDFSKIIIGNVN